MRVWIFILFSFNSFAQGQDAIPEYFEPRSGFTLSKTDNLNSGKPQHRRLDYNQSGFHDMWLSLIEPKTQSERYEVMTEMCRGMDQQKAVAFAGYIGLKNLEIYDYRRAFSSDVTEDAIAHETISLEDYYQTHRNYNGIGESSGRVEMGVCGDSARMVSDFLSHCGFSCEDVEIISYRTQSGGHQYVTARGDSGSMYTANWYESLEVPETNNPLEYEVPETMMSQASPTVTVFDCTGAPKGRTTTPLGTILMQAHGVEEPINQSGNYQEFATEIENFGLDEIVVKGFRGSDFSGAQDVHGAAIQVHQEFFKDNSRVLLELDGSLIFAKASRDVHIPQDKRGGGYFEVNQTILSPHIGTRLEVSAIRRDSFQLGAYGEFDATLFAMKTDVADGNGGKWNIDIPLGRARIGLNGSGTIGSFGYDGDVGLSGDFERSASQRGGNVLEDGELRERHIGFIPNHIFASGRAFWKRDGRGKPYIRVRYDNLYLFDRSQWMIGAGVLSPSFQIETNYARTSSLAYESVQSAGLQVSVRPRPSIELDLSGQRHFVEFGEDLNRAEFRVRVFPRRR